MHYLEFEKTRERIFLVRLLAYQKIKEAPESYFSNREFREDLIRLKLLPIAVQIRLIYEIAEAHGEYESINFQKFSEKNFNESFKKTVIKRNDNAPKNIRYLCNKIIHAQKIYLTLKTKKPYIHLSGEMPNGTNWAIKLIIDEFCNACGSFLNTVESEVDWKRAHYKKFW